MFTWHHQASGINPWHSVDELFTSPTFEYGFCFWCWLVLILFTGVLFLDTLMLSFLLEHGQ